MVWSLRLLYALADPGEGPGGPGGPGPPLFLDQTEARRAEKKIFETGLPPYLRVWMTGFPQEPIMGSCFPLSEGLYSPLVCTSLLRECDVLLVATWNYAYRNLEVGYNEFSPKMVMYLGLFKEETPRGAILVRNHLPYVIDHCVFAF